MASADADRRKPYQCGVCKASYGRSDHLIRHTIAHSKQRPFACPICGKAFARRDLLTRHVQAHNRVPQPSTLPSGAEAAGDRGRSGPRVEKACRSCAGKKLRCSDVKPCPRCVSKNIPCDAEPASPSPQTTDLLPLSNPAGNALAIPATASASLDGVARTSESVQSALAVDERALWNDSGTAAPPDALVDSHGDGIAPDLWAFTADLPSFGDYIQPDAFADLGDPDLLFVRDFELFSTQSGTQGTAPLDESPGMRAGADAYRDSIVSKGWNPGPRDGGLQAPILETSSVAPSDIIPPSASQRSHGIKGYLTMRTRDKILTMLWGVAPKSGWGQISVAFASMDFLKNLLQHALYHMQEYQLIPFVHLATFDVNAQGPELLGALVAYGAVNGRTDSIRAFGYSLQELVILAVQQRLEEEHAAVRDGDIAKAFYILLYLGYWSAISARIEAAESISSLAATILRRGKFLQAETYLYVPSNLPHEHEPLAQAWAAWAKAESRKRLVYFAMLLDAEISLARNTNPLFSYAEILTQLPASHELWEAGTAEQWQSILIRTPALRDPPKPIHTILRQPALITDQMKLADPTAVSAAVMAGYWAFVREYRSMESLLVGAQDSNNFVQKSRYAELHSLLDNLKSELDEMNISSPQVMILLALLQLHLNASYYDISAYSGRGTMQEALAAKGYVQRWSHSEQSRHAIFHAGQIIRLARNLKPGFLTDISVIALYHATETMWVWGLIQPPPGLPVTPHSLAHVALDAEDDVAVSRFLRSSRGSPGLTRSDGQFVSLHEPATVSDLASEVLKSNLAHQTYPLTTREVSRILQGFSSVGRSRISK